MCPLLVINFFYLVNDIIVGDGIGIILMVFSLAVGIWAVRGVYRRAKSIEESTSAAEIRIRNIKQEPKNDKEDEMEEHQGTPV